MEHTEVREFLELAAVEPAGLDRLAAGDTSEAAAVASHLAGCLSCTGEFERLKRTSALLRSVIATEPAPELRERTLAFVKAVGRDRPLMPSAIFADAGAASEPTGQRPGLGGRLRLGRPALWVASLAAAVIVSVGGTSLVLGKARNDPLGRETGQLVQVVDWTAQVERAPDARQVALRSRDDPAAGE